MASMAGHLCHPGGVPSMQHPGNVNFGYETVQHAADHRIIARNDMRYAELHQDRDAQARLQVDCKFEDRTTISEVI